MNRCLHIICIFFTIVTNLHAQQNDPFTDDDNLLQIKLFEDKLNEESDSLGKCLLAIIHLLDINKYINDPVNAGDMSPTFVDATGKVYAMGEVPESADDRKAMIEQHAQNRSKILKMNQKISLKAKILNLLTSESRNLNAKDRDKIQVIIDHLR